MTPQKDLEGNKGNNFNLLLTYFDANDNAISATFNNIEFKIFRSLPIPTNLVFAAGLTGVTYYLTGGTGGLSHDTNRFFVKANKDENNAALTGGIYFEFASDIMEKIPAGRNYYNVEVFKGSTFADMLLKGRFDVYGEDGGLI
jgi:hypothetical protein